ncbi:hypothetical protein AB4454_13105 [Vibrio artabrorum]|uniref:hypothetical protein n=1 Tax=Vibrio artabrorum TaxID=446374 RepID=UPI00354F3C6C
MFSWVTVPLFVMTRMQVSTINKLVLWGGNQTTKDKDTLSAGLKWVTAMWVFTAWLSIISTKPPLV